MKVGDFIRSRGGLPSRRGVVVEDHTMMCSHAVEVPYRMGAIMVLIEGKIERVIYSDWEVING